MTTPTDATVGTAELLAEASSLLAFGARSRQPEGFGWLADDGSIDRARGVQLWITGRMTHCFALGAMLGRQEDRHLAEHGIASLTSGPLRDRERNLWRSAVGGDQGEPGTYSAYDNSFVVLAASSAALAGVPGATDLLADALRSLETYWWDEEAGMVLDARDADTLQVDPYRGANANMHWVEALLAAHSACASGSFDSAGDDLLCLRRASRITTRIAEQLDRHDLRLPEHYDQQWHALLDYNRDLPADPFRPYGSTIGHWLEWSRLMVELRRACDAAGVERSPRLDHLPAAMYRAALREGWGPDGEPGFVYTVDFDGRPVVHARMYWVVCEAIGAARTLWLDTDDPSYERDVVAYWQWIRSYLIEAPGRWREELDASNRPAASTWSGKPDIYHATQAMLICSLPLRPSFAQALAAAPALRLP